jgi:rhamnosyltransferase
MKASIIIPTKNPGSNFQRVIDAVLLQDVDFEFEVLVIDSGSKDGTLEYVRSLADTKIRLHTIDPLEYGHGRTRNLGIELTCGEYAVLITHDALPADNTWLKKIVATADSDSTIAGVFGRHLAYPEADIYTKNELIGHFEGLKEFRLVSMGDPVKYWNDQGLRQILHFFSDNNALVRRSVWEKIPYPDVEFAEDQQWAKLVIEAGYKKAYAYEAVVYHSHQYNLLERMKRSFDESYAFKRYFGYTLCPDFGRFFYSWLGLTYLDLKKAWKDGYLPNHLVVVLKRPFDIFMKVLGHYLGGKGHKLPLKLRKSLSWDARLTK